MAELFTVRDLYRAAVSQTQYGFAEWYLAFHLRRHGFWSVLKCTVRNDPRKKKLLDRLLGSQARWLRKHSHRAAPPDLLVYSREAGLEWLPGYHGVPVWGGVRAVGYPQGCHGRPDFLGPVSKSAETRWRGQDLAVRLARRPG